MPNSGGYSKEGNKPVPAFIMVTMGFPSDSDSKESACNVGDTGSTPGSERSPGEGNGNPLQYSCLENAMDRGAWRGTVHGITKSQAQLNKWHFQFLKSINNCTKIFVITIVINEMKEQILREQIPEETDSGHKALHSVRVCKAKIADWKEKQLMKGLKKERSSLKVQGSWEKRFQGIKIQQVREGRKWPKLMLAVGRSPIL